MQRLIGLRMIAAVSRVESRDRDKERLNVDVIQNTRIS